VVDSQEKWRNIQQLAIIETYHDDKDISDEKTTRDAATDDNRENMTTKIFQMKKQQEMQQLTIIETYHDDKDISDEETTNDAATDDNRDLP